MDGMVRKYCSQCDEVTLWNPDDHQCDCGMSLLGEDSGVTPIKHLIWLDTYLDDVRIQHLAIEVAADAELRRERERAKCWESIAASRLAALEEVRDVLAFAIKDDSDTKEARDKWRYLAQDRLEGWEETTKALKSATERVVELEAEKTTHRLRVAALEGDREAIPEISLQLLNDCGINPFAVKLVAESFITHPNPRAVAFRYGDALFYMRPAEATNGDTE